MTEDHFRTLVGRSFHSNSVLDFFNLFLAEIALSELFRFMSDIFVAKA